MIKPKDLVGYNIHLSNRWNQRGETKKWFGGYLKDIQVNVTYYLINNVTLLIEQNFGVSMVIDGISQFNHSPNLKFIPVEPKETVSGVIVWKN